MSRRAELLARFRSGALLRIGRLGPHIEAVGAGREDRSTADELARELHTLKGEARMLRLPDVADAAHMAEQRLAAALEGRAPRLQSAVEIGEILEAICKALRDPSAGDAAASSARPQAAMSAAAARRWVRVDAAHVDDLCERLAQASSDLRALAAVLFPGPRVRQAPAAERGRREAFEHAVRQLVAVNEAAWSLRMSPCGTMLDAMAQTAKDIAAREGKCLRVDVRGRDVEIEREVLDAMWDPLVHAVTNAIDHGIEPPGARGNKPGEGCIELAAELVGANVALTVRDDGRGIDLEDVRRVAVARGVVSPQGQLPDAAAYALLFTHGFTTRDRVNALSGRGLGLDAARTVLDRVGGSVEIRSTLGQGTTLTMRVPARISKEPALVVDVGGALCGIAAREVLHVMRRSPGAIARVEHRGALVEFDERSPGLSLSVLAPSPPPNEPWTLLVDGGGAPCALHVAALVGERELVMRPVDAVLASLGYIRATAVLDDGRVIPILSLRGLLQLYGPSLQAPADAPSRLVAGASA
jgi:chemotaxis protein histidine kinase CheA